MSAALARAGLLANSSRIATGALATTSRVSTRPSVAMKLRNSGRIAFRRCYADEAPKSKPKSKSKPGKLRRTLRWTWRFTYLSVLGLTGYGIYAIYDDRHPEDQFQPDPTKKTLVILGKYMRKSPRRNLSRIGSLTCVPRRHWLGLCWSA